MNHEQLPQQEQKEGRGSAVGILESRGMSRRSSRRGTLFMIGTALAAALAMPAESVAGVKIRNVEVNINIGGRGRIDVIPGRPSLELKTMVQKQRLAEREGDKIIRSFHVRKQAGETDEYIDYVDVAEGPYITLKVDIKRHGAGSEEMQVEHVAPDANLERDHAIADENEQYEKKIAEISRDNSPETVKNRKIANAEHKAKIQRINADYRYAKRIGSSMGREDRAVTTAELQEDLAELRERMGSRKAELQEAYQNAVRYEARHRRPYRRY